VVGTEQPTLGIEKVGDGHRMGTVGDVRGLEDLLHVRGGFDAHVPGPVVSSRLTRRSGGRRLLLAERSRLLLDIGVFLVLSERRSPRDSFMMAYKLLVQGDLLQRHAVQLSVRGAQQRTRCEEHRRLHDCGRWDVQIELDVG